jgi:hypothetical protein
MGEFMGNSWDQKKTSSPDIISNWWLTYPMKNMKVRLDHHPNYWGNKSYVPNHQADMFPISSIQK